MGNYEQLKQAVSDVIKSNGNQEITGAILQNALLTIISTIGNNATFAGVATPETIPGTPDQNIFYIVSEKGEYPNFNVEIVDNEVGIFYNESGQWSYKNLNIAKSDIVNEINNRISLSESEIIVQLGVKISEKIYTNIKKGYKIGIEVESDADISYLRIDNMGIPSATQIVLAQKIVKGAKYIKEFTATEDIKNLIIWTDAKNIITPGAIKIKIIGDIKQELNNLTTKGTNAYTTKEIKLTFDEPIGKDPIQTANLTIDYGYIISTCAPDSYINPNVEIFENAPYTYGALYAIFNKMDNRIKKLQVGALAGNVSNEIPLVEYDKSIEFCQPIVCWLKGVVVYSIDVKLQIDKKYQELKKGVDSINSQLDGYSTTDIATFVESESFTRILYINAKKGVKCKIKIESDENIYINLLAITPSTEDTRNRYFWQRILPNNTYEQEFEVLVDGNIVLWTNESNINNGGTINYEFYILGLEERVYKLENPKKEKLNADIIPPAIYTVCNDITGGDNYIGSRNYSLKLYIDHFFRFWEERKHIQVENAENYFPFYSKLNGYGSYINSSISNQTKDLDEVINQINIVSDKIESFTIDVLHRSIRNKAVENGKVRLLCIGDSVTEGVHAAYNAPYNNSPKRYWEWVTALFAMDKEENENIGFDFLALGNLLGTSKSKTTFNIDFDNIKINDVTACACGVGGSKTQDWLNPNLNNGQINPFYDVVNKKFSLKYWVEKYRTLIVNPDGTTTRCDNNNKGELAPTDTNTNNVCEPTHVLIQLGYNQYYSSDGSTRQTYLSQLQEMIDTIRLEYPNVYILLSLPDTPGTYFPEYFPEYIGDNHDIYSLDFMRGTAKTAHNSFSFMNSDLLDLSNESENIYYCPTFFASPSCIGASHRIVNDFGYNSSRDIKQLYNTQCGSLPYLHPNNAAHANWAYQIYSLIKYTLII
jgi:hypothetical protein|nr:MAG TPA: XynB-like protein [Caudoviricetes sp.]